MSSFHEGWVMDPFGRALEFLARLVEALVADLVALEDAPTTIVGNIDADNRGDRGDVKVQEEAIFDYGVCGGRAYADAGVPRLYRKRRVAVHVLIATRLLNDSHGFAVSACVSLLRHPGNSARVWSPEAWVLEYHPLLIGTTTQGTSEQRTSALQSTPPRSLAFGKTLNAMVSPAHGTVSFSLVVDYISNSLKS